MRSQRRKLPEKTEQKMSHNIPDIPYLGVGDVAGVLGLTVVRIRQLAPNVPGAFKNSSGWQIPRDALHKPPLAGRLKPGPRSERSGKQKDW